MEEDDARDSGETAKTPSSEPIESQIKAAMNSRVSHFKEQADSLTFEGVRRLIEEDLGLERHALDVHKRYIKQCLLECLDGSDNDNGSKNSGEIPQNSAPYAAGETLSGELESKIEVKKSASDNEDKMEDSPVMGLLTSHKSLQPEAKGAQRNGNKGDITKGMIKKAIKKRASYFRANSENVTMAGVRRLLEEDLELDEYALDSHKKFISEQLEEVLQSPEVSKSASAVKKKVVKENLQKKVSKRVSPEGSLDSEDGEDDDEEDSKDDEEEEEEDIKPRRKTASKGRTQKSEGRKRKAASVKENKVSNKKRIKSENAASDSNSEAGDRGHDSDNSASQSSERSAKKKEVSTPAYGKRVDSLKSIIKSCGMSVPPAIYKKVKQVPENEREAFLVKELEEILSKEGLSASPTEKEIKEVKRRKERAKELEGIDMSNIVSSSRRRTASRYVAPPKPEVSVEEHEQEAGNTVADDGEDEDEEDEDEDEDEDDDNDDGVNEESQSEDLSEDQEESD